MPRVPQPRTALEHQAPHATTRTVGTIRVRAKRRGTYDHCLIEPGQVFFLASAEQLGSWMELAPDESPVVVDAPDATTAPKAKAAPKRGTTENDVL